MKDFYCAFFTVNHAITEYFCRESASCMEGQGGYVSLQSNIKSFKWVVTMIYIHKYHGNQSALFLFSPKSAAIWYNVTVFKIIVDHWSIKI